MDDFKTVSVLVLEDEFIIAMDLEDMLAGWGFGKVTIAHDSEAAWAALADGGPDVLVADFQLGHEETSYALIERARAGGSAVVVLTGGDIGAGTLAALGHPPVIDKPVRPETLREALAEVLRCS